MSQYIGASTYSRSNFQSSGKFENQFVNCLLFTYVAITLFLAIRHKQIASYMEQKCLTKMSLHWYINYSILHLF